MGVQESLSFTSRFHKVTNGFGQILVYCLVFNLIFTLSWMICDQVRELFQGFVKEATTKDL